MNEANVTEFEMLQDRQQRIDPGGITLVGGCIDEAKVHSWLAQWSFDKMPWRLWEYVSTLKLEENSPLPSDFSLLERGRLFGQAGDLTLRRDGDQFRWWFVGEKEFGLPANHGGADFWDAHPALSLCQIKQKAILWGAYQGTDQEKVDFWYDDRVGYAKLNYPPSLARHTHVYVKYHEFLERGQVAAVWMVDLAGGE